MRSNYNPSIDGLSLVALAFLAVMALNLLGGQATTSAAVAQVGIITPTPDLARVAPPYEHYVLTQGPHGVSYGHLAIDLAAGEGAVIQSPISGEVVEGYMDDLGNSTLVIENTFYRVTLLHGLYTVEVGTWVDIGQALGFESNQGYTVDMQGNPCWGRSGCGYHTHLNIYDKLAGDNRNPLELFEQR